LIGILVNNRQLDQLNRHTDQQITSLRNEMTSLRNEIIALRNEMIARLERVEGILDARLRQVEETLRLR
jgi:hypothetical protein